MTIVVRCQPAPWRSTGRGYVIALSCSRAFAAACGRAVPGLASRARGGPGALIYIDHATSDVRPYRELLLCPGAFDLDGRRCAVITHAWTSSVDSALGARRNWGLPGYPACFDPPQRKHDRETCRVRLPGCEPLTLSFGSHGPKLPMRSDMLPRRWQTLVQPWKGHYYQTCIQAQVMASAAWLDCCHVPSGSGFPDFSGQRVFMGLYADEFQLWFPRADITAINRRRNPHTGDGPAG